MVSFRTLGAAVCSLGGLVFGYDLGALATVAQSLREGFHLSPAFFGLTMATSLWGTVCGSIVAGRTTDPLGAPRLIGGCAALYLTAASLFFLPLSGKSWGLLLISRFLCGIAIGGFTVGCPLHLAEIAPQKSRGFFVGLFQLQVGLGVLLAFAVGTLGSHLISYALYSRVCLGVAVIPPALLLLLRKSMTPSPQWLADRHRWEEADKTADRLMLSEAEWQRERTHFSTGYEPRQKERLFSPKYTRSLFLATSIALFNQLSGVNILLLFLIDVLSSAGVNRLASHRYTVWIAGFNLVLTFFSMSSVDRFGRKPLLIAGAFGMALCLFSLAVSLPYQFPPIWYLFVIVAYNGLFAFSQGTIVWIYLSELFPFGVRGAGQSYGATVHWIANALLVSLFPLLERAGAAKGFYLFATMMLLQIAVVFLWYPETKGKALGIQGKTPLPITR